MMVWVRTQAEVCEYFGKNPDGRTFVSRMISKGKVVKESGGYTILEEVKVEQPKVEKVEKKEEKSDLSELEELRINYEYLHKKFQRLKAGYNLVIDLTYQVVSRKEKIEKSEYKEQLADEVNRILDEKYGRLD